MKKITAVIIAVMAMGMLAACGDSESEDVKYTNVAEYDNCSLELNDATVVETPDGGEEIWLNAVFANDNPEGLYAYGCYDVKAYQDGEELTDTSDIYGDEADLLTSVKDGGTVTVRYTFALKGQSNVDVCVSLAGGDGEIMAEKLYTY